MNHNSGNNWQNNGDDFFGQDAMNPGTILNHSEEKIVRLDGEKITVNTIKYTIQEDGTPIKTEEITLITDARGKVIIENEFGYYCKSWQGHWCRHEEHGVCAMCWEEEGRHRYVCLGVDGILTDKGNCVCSECQEKNKRREKWFGILGLFGRRQY